MTITARTALALPDLRRAIAFAVASIFVGTFPTTAGRPLPRQDLDMRVPLPPTPVTIDGTPRLVYELHLANYGLEPVFLELVEVVNAEGGAVIAELGDEALDHRLGRPGLPSAEGGRRTLAPGSLGVLYLELELDGGPTPQELEHRALVHEVGADAPPPVVVRGGRVPIRAEPPAVLAPPLRGGPWAAVYHPSWERSHRRVVYAAGGGAARAREHPAPNVVVDFGNE
jgi:hypothetical protein